MGISEQYRQAEPPHHMVELQARFPQDSAALQEPDRQTNCSTNCRWQVSTRLRLGGDKPGQKRIKAGQPAPLPNPLRAGAAHHPRYD